jgi:methylphosphotriester-DNA--protein-cysteine methyltransferase
MTSGRGRRKLYKIRKPDRFILSKTPGKFAGIVTQGIFGRLDCSSGKRAHRQNRVFFHTWKDAVAAGMRPCKHCKPEP